MMRNYAVFYRNQNGSYVKPCGTDSVLCIDGRLNYHSVATIAKQRCKQYQFDAFSIQRAVSIHYVNCADNPLINLHSAN